MLIYSEFLTAGAVAENAREETHVVAAEVDLNPNVILLLDHTPQFHRKDMTVVQFVLHEKWLLQSCTNVRNFYIESKWKQ